MCYDNPGSFPISHPLGPLDALRRAAPFYAAPKNAQLCFHSADLAGDAKNRPPRRRPERAEGWKDRLIRPDQSARLYFFSMSEISPTRRAWRPPSNSVSKKVSTIIFASSVPTTRAPMAMMLALLCSAAMRAE